MVDLTRPTMIGVSFKDYYKRPQCVHLGIDVVLLDKTTTPLVPSLYQLNSPGSASISYQAFTLLGEVVAIDTQKKMVTLSNDNIVTYQHLIIATGPQTSWMNPMPEREFAAGIQILMEALRMQASKPTTPKSATKSKIKSSKAAEETKGTIPKPTPQKAASPVTKDPKRIYQVQL